jgi:dipeptidyl aminopeptidase/acylaminoacyl peptidase
MGAEMQHDLTDATLWAIKQGHADADRICIYGASYGGYAALMGAAMEPDLYQCSIGYVGLYDISLWGQADTVRFEGGRRFVDEAWNYNDTAFVKARSPLTHASKIKAPVMLVHGGKDPRVPVANYHRMKDALTQAGNEPVTLLKTYEGHGFFDLENNVELYDKMLRFLKQHLGQSNGQPSEPATTP